MDNKKINRLSRIGSWLVCFYLILPITVGIILFIFSYLKLLPVDCSVGGWVENISGYLSADFLVFVGYLVSVLGFIVSLVSLSSAFIFKTSKKNSIYTIILFVIFSLSFWAILSSLAYSRSKTQMAGAIATLSSFRSSAEEYYNNNQSYGDSSKCDESNTLFSKENPQTGIIISSLGKYAKEIQCFSNKESYALSARLVETNSICRKSHYWCVDSDNKLKEIKGPITRPSCGD